MAVAIPVTGDVAMLVKRMGDRSAIIPEFATFEKRNF